MEQTRQMNQPVSTEHKNKFAEMKKSLIAIGAKEGNFLQVEILFYDAMSIAREYGNEEAENGLLAAFKELQRGKYQQTKAYFKTSVQRETAIRRFNNSLRGVLTAASKNLYYQPQLT